MLPCSNHKQCYSASNLRSISLSPFSTCSISQTTCCTPKNNLIQQCSFSAVSIDGFHVTLHQPQPALQRLKLTCFSTFIILNLQFLPNYFSHCKTSTTVAILFSNSSIHALNWFSMLCEDFALKHPQNPASSTLTQSIPSTATAQSRFLAKWLVDNSWTTCGSCMCLLPNPLLPKGNILKRFLLTCACSTFTTLFPTFDMFHDILRCLSIKDQQILSPFRFDNGPLRLQQHGYCVKTSGFDLLTKQTSVWDQIQAVKVENRHRVLEQAYTHLMSWNNSHYSHFIHLHNSHTLQQKYTLTKPSAYHLWKLLSGQFFTIVMTSANPPLCKATTAINPRNVSSYTNVCLIS